MSTFSGLSAATTALWAQRRGLDVTGQNISNVNTEGYSRQRLDMRAIGGSPVPAVFSTSTGIGGGVTADDVARIRDVFLEHRGRTEHASHARLTVESEALTLVEQALREPGDAGIQNALAEMWSGWESVANNPRDEPTRSELLRRVESLTAGFHMSAAALDSQWGQNRDDLAVLIADVNTAAAAVADLNGAIRQATQAGLPSNELADRRDLLIMQLAQAVGATGRPGKDGVVDVSVGGISLVAGSSATPLQVLGSTDPDDVTTDPPRVVTTAGGFTVRPGGTVAGQLTTLTEILPGYRNRLDALAADLAATLNAAHAGGFDLDGNAGTDLLGSSSGPVTAASIKLLTTSPRAVAASAVPPGPTGPNLDKGNADAIARLRFSPTGPDAGYRQMIVDLGVQAAVSSRNLDIQGLITTQLDAAREAVAGVNLDEEMTNMLSFQHAYSAASRLVSAIDESLDVLINRTGRVGL